MPRTKQFPFRKSLLAIAIGAALVPSASWALDLVQAPPLPTSKSTFVAPNVIISIDDSGSMNWATSDTDSRPRMTVLKNALRTVFNDRERIPENKIRIAWQVMHNNGNSPHAKSVNYSGLNTNSMRPIDAVVSPEGKTHRENFLDFVNKLTAGGGTPSHHMFSQADAYMRRPLNNSSPWSSNPGGDDRKSTEYLGCRRNYHIMMTDGRWNVSSLIGRKRTGGNQDGADWPKQGDRLAYDTTSEQTRIYYDSDPNTLSDWAFKSWMQPLQEPQNLKDADKLKPVGDENEKDYDKLPATELFSATRTLATYGWVEECTRRRPNGECRRWEWVWKVVDTRDETKQVNLEKYWNPKYNPATWPHMVTYTIGFSEEAVTWPGASNITAPSKQDPFGYDNGFIDLVTGWETWPNMDAEDKRSLDLWHAAINGRGRFYAVTKAEDLAKAFDEIIGKINEESVPLPEQIAGGSGTSGYNVSQNDAGIFASVYRPNDGWSGYISATSTTEPEEYACPSEEDPDATCFRFESVVSGWEDKTTADRLDDLSSVDNRLVLSWSDESQQGIPFKWTSGTEIAYSEAQKKALLGLASGEPLTDDRKTEGMNLVNFIRGDRSLEGEVEGKPFRKRHSRQGDIVNSEIWYTGGPISNYAMGYSAFVTAQKDRTPMLYVGGNDGMLHGFSAKDGRELLAYVPRGVVRGLKELADKDYEHRYYVDGSPFTGDVKTGSGDTEDDWRTYLVGALGAGGKGYFLLDVTHPDNFSGEAPENLAVLDRTRGNNEAGANDADKDIGNITAKPVRNPANLQETTQITRMNDDRWAVVLGNGYNSDNQRPVLLVQYLDGARELVRVQATTDATGTGNANDNGLASPTLVDLDGDGKTDVVYAGDNLGNLWKFDLTSRQPSDWKVAFGNNQPLFTARGPKTPTSNTRDQIQPITAPPIVRANDRFMTVGEGEDAKTVPVGGMQVMFGTGRNLTEEDRRTDIPQNVQTLYSVLDNTRYRMRASTTANQRALEVHPGEGDCASAPASCVPAPTPVGTIANDGSPLARQTITDVNLGTSGEFATVNATQELTTDTWHNFSGWYLDLPFSGERLLKPMQFYDGSNIVAVYTESPAGTQHAESDNINESCVPIKVNTSAGTQFRTLINLMDGKPPSVPLVDADGNGVYDSNDLNVNRAQVNTGTPTLITYPDNVVDHTGAGGDKKKNILARMPEQATRPSWRQLK